jgi:phage baseplate assembly protein W
MSIYRGFSTVGRNKKFRITDFELIKQDLLNHFYIRKGEKLMNPNFGTIIWNMIFENLTPELKSVIQEDVKRIVGNEPRVQVDNILVTEYQQGLQIELDLSTVAGDKSEILFLRFNRDTQNLSVQ